MKGPDLVLNLDARYVLGAVSLGKNSLKTAQKVRADRIAHEKLPTD